MTDVAAPDPDLSPREPRPTRGSRLGWVVVAIVAVAIAALLWILLSGATLFFRNVDEAVADRAELGDERFRLQGTVVAGTVTETTVGDSPAVAFAVVYDCVFAEVVHVGSPPQLFQDDIPVVLEGRWRGVEADTPPAARSEDGFYFASDEMFVKHDNEYVAESGEKIDAATTGGRADDCGT